MKLWQWEAGRQSASYSKFTLLYSKTLGIDAYILNIPRGSYIPQHTDPVPGFEHHRVNITLIGQIIMRTKPWNHPGVKRFGIWFSYFRPDQIVHWAPPASKNTYIFSFGWTRKQK